MASGPPGVLCKIRVSCEILMVIPASGKVLEAKRDNRTPKLYICETVLLESHSIPQGSAPESVILVLIGKDAQFYKSCETAT